MRAEATSGGAGKSWVLETSRWMLAGGWREKIAGKGEDAEPAVRIHRSGAGLLAVFDGAGGSGSASARRLADGSDLSGAYVASRLAKEVVEAWATEQIARGDELIRPDDLQARLTGALQHEASYRDVPTTALKGSLRRVLPTTMAAIRFTAAPDALWAHVLWAGDSRAYVLTPGAGLQVLTVDDTRETDALELIRNDQPMANLLCADRPFTVNHLQYRLDLPTVVLVATDGCFGYVRTPAHFEHLLLASLARSSSAEEWADDLIETFGAIAADDISFAIGAFGFGDHARLKRALQPRGDYLAQEHWAPFERYAYDPDEIEALRGASWEVYRDLYHARLLADPA
jgi:hypothetical protein